MLTFAMSSTHRVSHVTSRPEIASDWRVRSDLTVDDVDALALAGAFTEYDNLELIDGRLVPVSPAGRRHEVVKEALTRELMRLTLTRKALADVFVAAGPQFNLSNNQFTKPDILLRPMGILTPDVRGPMALLVIEVADTSLTFDTTDKALLYAAHGVRDYWVIDAWSLTTTFHREPAAAGYRSAVPVAQNKPVAPLLMANLKLRLDQLAV
jgi:Uma2 family endonuclease